MEISSPQTTDPVKGPGVDYNTFTACVWAGFALDTLFIIFRLVARYRGPRRLFWDDGLLIFGYILNIISSVLWQCAGKDMYYTLEATAQLTPIGADFVPRTRRWLVFHLVVEVFFYTTLLAVKLSFLFFFRRLGQNTSGQKYIWWPVLIFSLMVFVVSVGDIQFKCIVGPTSTIMTFCLSAESSYSNTLALTINCALDVLSDFLIITIPIMLLWNVRIPWRRKFAFMSLFSLSITTIGVAITRAADIGATAQLNGRADTTYLWLWSSIQASLAVIVACLSAFPQLFAQSNQKHVWTPTNTYYHRLRTRMKRTQNSSDPLYSLSVMTRPGGPNQSLENYEAPGNQEPGFPAASYNGQGPFLVPGGLEHTITCSGGPTDHRVVLNEDQITQQLEYRVT